MKRLCYVATIPAVVHAFLRGHIEAAAKEYAVTVICNSAEQYLLQGLSARVIVLPIQRKPSPWSDLLVLLRLFFLFRGERFDIVHSIMPKTGLLAMLASCLAGVPVRIHTFTGQVWVTKRGLQRWLLKRFDKLICRFASCVLADSPSQQSFLLEEGVLSSSKARVIGAGSICGVDTKRFVPSAETRQRVRRELGIAQDARVILFVGRLNLDKGMRELAAAFGSLIDSHLNTELLLVGTEEDVSFREMLDLCPSARGHMRHLSFTAAPERYMAAADVFCLPSYREGFGMTIIEAAACGLPCVASRIYGITDAVADGETGLLVPPGDVPALGQSLNRLVCDDSLRRQMGNAARVRILRLFRSEKVTGEMVQLYNSLLLRE